MTSINEIFRTFGPEYLQRYANSMPKTHRKVIDAMMACRTESCGLAIYQCETCAESHQLYRSCGNRHCPTCQQHKTRQWLEKQINRQLPTHHFLITFTVPEDGLRIVQSIIRRVVFPDPFGPRITIISPGSTLKSRPWRASVLPYFLIRLRVSTAYKRDRSRRRTRDKNVQPEKRSTVANCRDSLTTVH